MISFATLPGYKRRAPSPSLEVYTVFCFLHIVVEAAGFLDEDDDDEDDDGA